MKTHRLSKSIIFFFSLFLLASPLVSANLQDGLVAYFHLNTTIDGYAENLLGRNDSSFYQFNLTHTEAFTNASGVDTVSNATWYNSTGAHSDLGTGFIGSDGPVSVSLWFKAISVGASNGILGFPGDDGDDRKYCVIRNTGAIRCDCGDGSNNKVATSSKTINTGQWYSLIYTCSDTFWNVYIDGEPWANASTDSNEGVGPWIFGMQAWIGETGGNIVLDNIGVWNKSLTYNEVLNLSGNNQTYPIHKGTPSVPPASNGTLGVYANNSVNGSFVGSGICAYIDNTTHQVNVCNQTGTIAFYTDSKEQRLNITLWNVTGASYFNVTFTNVLFNSSGRNLFGQVHQSILNISLSKKYLNTSVNTFNITNNRQKNTTTTGVLQIKANSGPNNVFFSPRGNHTGNKSCSGASLTITNCVVQGVYDNQWTIGAAFLGQGVETFTIQAKNSSLGVLENTSTTTGNVTLELLQGYLYEFDIFSTQYSRTSQNLTGNNLTQYFNFSVLITNTFNLTFLDELTENPITENITLSVISDVFAQNYTITNSTQFNVSALSPTLYTLRYKSQSYVQRDYIVRLINGTFNTLKLYDIRINDSSQIVATVQDTGGNRLENATISLLRYYVSCNCYETVEMSSTSANGESIFYVQASDGFYKWSITYNGVVVFLSTVPENIVTDTRNFIVDLGSNFYQSYNTVLNMTRTVTYNRETGAVVFTWADPSLIVTQACLTIDYLDGSKYTQEAHQCSSSATGSIVLIVSDPNNTRYRYSADIETNTPYSNHPGVLTGWLDPLPAFLFGTIGLFLGFALITTLALIFSFNVAAVMGVTAVGVLFLYLSELATLGTAFVGGIIVLALGMGVFLARR